MCPNKKLKHSGTTDRQEIPAVVFQGRKIVFIDTNSAMRFIRTKQKEIEMKKQILMTAILGTLLSPASFAASLTQLSCKVEQNQPLNLSLLDGSPRLGQQASGTYGAGQTQMNFSNGSWFSFGTNISISIQTWPSAQNQYSKLDIKLSQIGNGVYGGLYKMTSPFGDFEEGRIECLAQRKN